jgi:hypothetical protein
VFAATGDLNFEDGSDEAVEFKAVEFEMGTGESAFEGDLVAAREVTLEPDPGAGRAGLEKD